MIKIYKHFDSPKSLSKKVSWTEEDVIEQLKSDQRAKCYLCERIQTTDFQVEHHKSRSNYDNLKFTWSNLLWCCNYCNGKKSSFYDNLLNPIEENIEDLIQQTFDFPNAKVIFTNTTGNASEEIDSTISLLNRIFNGSTGIRKIREQRFYDYALSKITAFQETVISWLITPTVEIQNSIMEQLNIDSEFLGFKYWIIKSNNTLLKTFGQNIVWNKR